jgi:hypothetical protein
VPSGAPAAELDRVVDEEGAAWLSELWEARARLPSGRHDRAAELDAGGDARRAVPADGRVRPTAVRANAARNGRDAEFDDALNAFCDEHNRGPAGAARFEKEYLVAIGTRV